MVSPFGTTRFHSCTDFASNSSAQRGVVQCHTHRSSMMAVVLSDDALALQLPQSRIVITARSNQIRTIGTEGAIPNPALVASQSRLQRKALCTLAAFFSVLNSGSIGIRQAERVVVGVERQVVERRRSPDAGSVVGRASSQLADVGGQQHTRDVGVVSGELADGDEAGDVAVEQHAPDEDAAGVVAGAQHRPVRRHRHRRHRHVVFGYQLVRASVLAQIPHAHLAASVARDQFALVGMDHHVVDGRAVPVVSLDAACARIPNLDCAIFRARHHPFALAMERHACYIVCMPFEGENRGRVG